MNNKKSINAILQRMTEIEKELHVLREELIQCATSSFTVNCEHNTATLQFTMDDLCEAFGKKHQSYAVRLRNALVQYNITNLSDFLALTPGQLFDIEGIGPITLQYTNKAMKKLGIRW